MLRATDSCIILLCRTNLVLEYSFPFASMNVSTCFEWYFACFLSIIDVMIDYRLSNIIELYRIVNEEMNLIFRVDKIRYFLEEFVHKWRWKLNKNCHHNNWIIFNLKKNLNLKMKCLIFSSYWYLKFVEMNHIAPAGDASFLFIPLLGDVVGDCVE